MMKVDFEFFSKTWKNEFYYNDFLYKYFESKVEKLPYLQLHFDMITKNSLGFGEKAFRYFWYLILDEIKSTRNDCKFLEIGVYKGSILSLATLIGDNIGLDVSTFGVTPLNSTGDKYSQYPECDYFDAIWNTFKRFGLSTHKLEIIKGLSTDADVIGKVIAKGAYNVVYIDGGHDYDTVTKDINLAHVVLCPGGYMVLDDSSWLLKIGTFQGHYEVSRAAMDFFTSNEDYRHLFACGHNRVWQKVR